MMSPGFAALNAVCMLVLGEIETRCVAPTTAGVVYQAGSVEVAGAVTVTRALPVTEPLEAVTEKVPAVEPAAYAPEEPIVPPVAVHAKTTLVMTAPLESLAVAVKASVPPVGVV